MTDPAAWPVDLPCPLTARELRILELVADGQSNKAIAERLDLSPMTVKSHLARIAAKLRMGDRAGMVAICMRSGWLS